MNKSSEYLYDNKLRIPEKLLKHTHSQLRFILIDSSSKKSWDVISNYLYDYFNNKFKEKYTDLYHLFNSLGIGLSAANIERALKGKKGIKKVNVKYELLDFLCYAVWEKSLAAKVFDPKVNWDKKIIHDVNIPEYAQDEINKHLSSCKESNGQVELKTNVVSEKKTNEEIKNTGLEKLVKTITLENWNTSTNFSTPQWADYFKIPIENGFIKRVRCQIITTSEYYRFGFKLFRNNGKLFGDGSIQSMDNNFVIHIGKNFLSDELFITTYHNGILQRPDKSTNVKPLNNRIKIELFIDDENFLCLFLDGKGVFKIIINKEIREQIYMLAWGDVSEYQLSVENIEIEYEIG